MRPAAAVLLLALAAAAPAAGGGDRARSDPPGWLSSAFSGLRQALRGDRPFRLVTPLPRPLPAPPLPAVRGPAGRPLVVIDAGHGGQDPGAVSGGIAEKAVALAAARAIADALLAGGRLRVALTRSDDRFLLLEERYGIARRLGADLFISLHADAAPGGGARGATVYTWGRAASDSQAARLARRENEGVSGDNIAVNIVGEILGDLTRRETAAAADAFADRLVEEAAGRIAMRTTPRRQASLAVLRAPDTPSVLIEMGYLDNPADRAALLSAEHRSDIAQAVRVAAERQFADRALAAQVSGIAATR
ncbi:N-acetylmuramoyl-L-alanine amidase [Sphingomonas jejuensis]|uniref:N-acetylmuramoyl-L-alanine amidase n=1 Tax=Sphingomonas jejuensis TaxID=904715 RepID=A0ABX0XKP9_9SPHN|nr:N-acetylmuramoyl-L-alanine amidase [Sphingomonas jejuensis]NJC33941.1 N-acetylmuramoyl-L-alanine amidase [Sphingomonas jejuensis]